MPETEFTPAAGRFLLTSVYDRLLAVLTREVKWRAAMLAALAPKPGERILDVGSGTGSFAILIKQREPQAIVVGLDPNPEARRIAAAKAAEAGVEVAWQSGFARDAANFGQFDKLVSSLVFHQVPVEEKRAGLAAMFKAARPGGRVLIVDYARAEKLVDAPGVQDRAVGGRPDQHPAQRRWIYRTRAGPHLRCAADICLGLGHAYRRDFYVQCDPSAIGNRAISGGCNKADAIRQLAFGVV